MSGVYMDDGATTKPMQEVVDAMIPYLTELYFNPSSLYAPAVNVKKDIENARKTIADFIGADTEEIYFTSGASESNNWVVRGWDDSYLSKCSTVIISTRIEHKSLIAALENPALFSKVCYCEVDSNGVVKTDSLKKLLQEHEGWNVLVTIGAANGEIGTVQPIEKIAEIVRTYPNAVFHTDATQILPHRKINVHEIGIDMLSASAQKFGGPKGIGFLYKRNGMDIAPLIRGAQEGGQRGGTYNAPGIIGMAKAAELTKRFIECGGVNEVESVRDYLMGKMKNLCCLVNGSEFNRLPNNVNVILPECVGGEELLYLLDMSNVYIGIGSACNSFSKEPSYILKSIGLTDDEAARTIRLTIPQGATYEDIDYVVNEIKKSIGLLKANYMPVDY